MTNLIVAQELVELSVWEELLIMQEVLLVEWEVAGSCTGRAGGTTGGGCGAGGLPSAMINYFIDCAIY